MPYISTQKGEELAKKVAEKVGVKAQYLALFRSSAKLVQDHGPNSALAHMDRLPEYRVDAGANAGETLQKQGVMVGDSLKLLLRPLHGDHIHYAFSIYYKGEPVDMNMIQDRPVLAVANNISQQDKKRKDVCSPDHSPDQTVPGAESSYVGPKVWEGNHIDTVFPHFGMHIGHPQWFGFGLMHIHPATAWQWFEESEGLGANLDTVLEQVGIWVWEQDSRRYPFHTPLGKAEQDKLMMDFPEGLQTKGTKSTKLVSNVAKWSYCDYPTNRLLIANDQDYVWRLYYWPFSDKESLKESLNRYSVLTERFGRVWLHENMGMITLSYEKKAPASRRCPMRSLLSTCGATTTTPKSKRGSLGKFPTTHLARNCLVLMGVATQCRICHAPFVVSLRSTLRQPIQRRNKLIVRHYYVANKGPSAKPCGPTRVVVDRQVDDIG